MFTPADTRYAAVRLPAGTSQIALTWGIETTPFNAGVEMDVWLDPFDAAPATGTYGLILEVDEFSGSSGGVSNRNVTVPADGWYRLQIRTNMYWYVSGSPGPGTWTLQAATQGQQSCAPSALEMNCACSEGSPSTPEGMATAGNPIGNGVG